MDLVKAFTENNQTVTVNIQGTHDDPLFQANQIGELLDIKNIRDTLGGFDEDEDEVHVGTTTDTNAGQRNALFLTEIGAVPTTWDVTGTIGRGSCRLIYKDVYGE